VDIVNEIREYFASLMNGQAILIQSFKDRYPAWVIRLDNRYGVAVQVSEDTKINENFANVKYHTEELYVDGERRNLLLLSSNIEELRMEFSTICARFIHPGENGDYRRKITLNPLDWWTKWKDLLGNSIYENPVYSVLGELITFLYLLKKEIQPKWIGPLGGTVDFESPTADFEVKSTINKYNNIITVSGQFQLKANKTLSLIFCRFEETNFGISIDSIMQQLVIEGVDELELNNILLRLGMEAYSSDRKKQFKILELREYKVNNEFPIITVDSFKNGKIPENIIQIIYKVDLSGLEYNQIDLKFIEAI